MRFLLDGMLGNLARWLRIIGYDATYVKDRQDRDLILIAKRASITLLTSDLELYRVAVTKGVDCFLVRGVTLAEKLANLARRYKMRVQINPKVSRCPVCGSRLKETLKRPIRGSVPPGTFKAYKRFWVCANSTCAKIYWRGSHWRRIEQTLQRTRRMMKIDSTSPGRHEVDRSP